MFPEMVGSLLEVGFFGFIWGYIIFTLFLRPRR